MMLDLEAVGIYGPPFIPATSLAPSALHPPKQQQLLTKANNNKAQPGTATNQVFIFYLHGAVVPSDTVPFWCRCRRLLVEQYTLS